MLSDQPFFIFNETLTVKNPAITTSQFESGRFEKEDMLFTIEEIDNKKELTIQRKDKTILKALYLNSKIKKKTSYLHLKNAVVELELAGLTEDRSKYRDNTQIDLIKVTSKDEKCAIELSGNGKITKEEDKPRVLHYQFNHLEVNGERMKISLKSKGVDYLNDLLTIKIIQLKWVLDAIKREFPRCRNCPQVAKSVFRTVYGHYFYQLSPEIFTCLTNNYGNLLKEIILSDSRSKRVKVREICGSLPHIQNNLMMFDQKLPSTIENRFIKIQNGSGAWVSLPESSDPRGGNYKIIFDSGNDTITTIGSRIVQYLNLETYPICKIVTTGIGGESKLCGKAVDLNFRFDKSFDRANNNQYTVTAFVKGDTLEDTLLFGHANGLDVLFQDGFLIGERFRKGDPRKTRYEEEIRHSQSVLGLAMYQLRDMRSKLDEDKADIVHIIRSLEEMKRNNHILHQFSSHLDTRPFFKEMVEFKELAKEKLKTESEYRHLDSLIVDILENRK